jgi:hypothetical protein
MSRDRFCWIDLDESAVRLNGTRYDVSALINDGVLPARTFDGAEYVVRSDDVDGLAGLLGSRRRQSSGGRSRQVSGGGSSAGGSVRFE